MFNELVIKYKSISHFPINIDLDSKPNTIPIKIMPSERYARNDWETLK